MIKSIKISNYAILDNIELVLGDKLNIITGETGAGKSIILGALGLIMGNRADSNVLYDAEKKCVVEAVFSDFPQSISSILEDNDYDNEEELIIRREIIPSGKSRAFVNDTPAKLNFLQSIAGELVDLNSQFQITEIFNSNFQIDLIDAFANNQKNVNDYRVEYKTYRQNINQLEKLKSQSSLELKELDFIRYQKNELEEAALVENELADLESQSKLLEKVDEITQLVSETHYLIDESDQNIKSTIRELIHKWSSYSDGIPEIAGIEEKLNEAIDILDEVDQKTQNLDAITDNNPSKLLEIRDRLDVIYNLQKKHGAQTTEDLLIIQAELTDKLGAYEGRTEKIELLQSEVTSLKKALTKRANTISNKRKKVFSKLEKVVNDKLTDLSMTSAELKIDHRLADDLHRHGLDEIEFLFKANKGSQFLPIKKVASGGESARLMLSLKSTVAGAMDMPTMIFDEIDTGVSGEVAGKMGAILKSLSKDHQLICITHSPQVAAKADQHFFVYKEDKKNRTITQVKTLEPESRIIEIAKMLSGDPPSTFALDNAKDLLQMKV